MTVEYILRAAIVSMIKGHHAPYCYTAHVPGKGYVNNGTLQESRADYLAQLERSAMSELENMTYASGYAEPGYADPERGILFTNWNIFPRGLDTILDRAGYAVEWSDEWSICECGKAIRTEADSYSWTPSYAIIGECSIVCHECLADDPNALIEEYLNDSDKALTPELFDAIDLRSAGFEPYNDDAYENGFFPGQNDTPADIVKNLPPNVGDWIFVIDSVRQFDMRFSLWVRPTEAEE